MKTYPPFIPFLATVAGLCCLCLSGCNNEAITPSPYFFKVYETILTDAKGLDAVSCSGGYMIMADDDTSPLFIRTKSNGEMDTTWSHQKFIPYCVYPNPGKIIEPQNDTSFQICGYFYNGYYKEIHLYDIKYSTKIFSFSINGMMDTCMVDSFSICDPWSTGSNTTTDYEKIPPVLAATRLSDGTVMIVERPSSTNFIRFINFDLQGNITREAVVETYGGESWHFPRIRRHESYLLVEDPDRQQLFVTLFTQNADGQVKQNIYTLPTSLIPDSMKRKEFFDANTIYERYHAIIPITTYTQATISTVGNVLQLSGAGGFFNLLDLDLTKPINYALSSDSASLYVIGTLYGGGVILYNFDGKSVFSSSETPRWTFRRTYGEGSPLEASSVRILDNGDLLICGSSYFSGLNPRPFLMRVNGTTGDL